MKNILITGGAGFIGSNFIKHMLATYDYKIVNLDLLTYAGKLNNLNNLDNKHNYKFIQGNICDRKLVEKIFLDNKINTLINFAAESHVDRSIEDPEIFLKTNVLGTQILLDTAKKFWKINTHDKHCNKYKDKVKFIQISTDEVYGTLGSSGYFTETTPLAPNSPYSASKASADLFVRAYNETFALPINITRCSNNYGPHQYPEKLIPLMINNCLNDLPLPIYGDGQQIRDWLHVYDHCTAIDCVLHYAPSGQVYNIGGNNEITNIKLVKTIIHQLGKSESLIKYVNDRPGHDRRYAIDNSKITTQLNWIPKYTFNQGLKETIDWYSLHT
ncbi:MAG: dTDP-glucose 4,6-dehydratase [Epulopiscium sp. Nuni2H_MBin001]|nr:MAG: dTDP-glucose 4,6-dehydratase [Epulopiscium sp. Nuni2H_MBin001]